MATTYGRPVQVASADRTVLAAEVRGQGSPLVLVHGTSVDRDSWERLPALLAARHTVWSYDRRGRGGSGDGETYALEREVEDIRAVLAAVGEPAHLVGHSFGGMCALEAVVAGVSPRSLVLYEPPVHVERVSAAVERSVARLSAGDPDGAVAVFSVDVAGMSPGELERSRSFTEEWNSTIERAPTITREIQELARLRWQPTRFRAVTLPTLYIAGGITEGPVYPTEDDIAAALPHALHVTIPGQGHVAFAGDPEGFAEVVLEFTRRHDAGRVHI